MPRYRVSQARPTQDGAGVKIRRIPAFSAGYDPLLMLDELKATASEDYIGGFPPHPHRGFETITYLLAGGLNHRDSQGHEGGVSRGGAQWMRAGRGVIHSEMPVLDQAGLHGFQLWINLPAAEKMSAPAYRDVRAEEIPELTFAGGSVRLIADHWQLNQDTGQGALATLGSGAGLADLTLAAEAQVQVTLPKGYALQVYVYAGDMGTTPEEGFGDGHLLSFPLDNQPITLRSQAGGRALLISGRPLGEPIVHYGPFVMNSQAEIEQALQDYQAGRLGQLSA
ncbi:pirin family protein [Halothiobacillus sp. DCM-1]|uniref:pirin family protein n=1 Tax=Halothiobacillus sp. DCM-1 TaxID=3112558 RepID=UPI003254C080